MKTSQTKRDDDDKEGWLGETDEINILPLPSPIVTRILVHVLTVSYFVLYWVYNFSPKFEWLIGIGRYMQFL